MTRSTTVHLRRFESNQARLVLRCTAQSHLEIVFVHPEVISVVLSVPHGRHLPLVAGGNDENVLPISRVTALIREAWPLHVVEPPVPDAKLPPAVGDREVRRKVLGRVGEGGLGRDAGSFVAALAVVQLGVGWEVGRRLVAWHVGVVEDQHGSEALGDPCLWGGAPFVEEIMNTFAKETMIEFAQRTRLMHWIGVVLLAYLLIEGP